MDSFFFEVITKREVTKHFKECMVTRCATYVLKVTCTHTCLACCNTTTRRYQFPCKERL